MRHKITLKQIARELDVSISTVSKALKNSKEISLETREKIQAFAKMYNYKPNSIALSLKNRKTKTLGVIIPEIVHDFFATVIRGIEEVANQRGYSVMVSLSNEQFEKEVISMDTLVNNSIDGFIISISKETLKKKDYHHLTETMYQGIPIVMFDRVLPDLPCDKVSTNDRQAAKQAVEKLIQEGRRNILLITTEDYVTIGRLRTQGYLDALKLNGLDIRPELMLKVNDAQSYKENMLEPEEQIRKSLKALPSLDGIFAVNEIYALSAMKALREQGLSIPQDVSVIGFSNGVLSRHSYPELTTMDQHGEKIGNAAANLLIDKLEELTSEEEYTTKIIKATLVERQSTAVKEQKKGE